MTLRRGILWTVLVLGALEVVLQVGALVVAWTAEDRSGGDAARAAGTRVLCVGDSFTYGFGATGAEAAYPARVEVELGERGRAVGVVNAGYPGQASGEVLRKLDGQMREVRPEVVCVLVGTNDRWRLPERVTTEELDAAAEADAEAVGNGFVWRWRTKRLIEWALQGDEPAYTRGVRVRRRAREVHAGFAWLPSWPQDPKPLRVSIDEKGEVDVQALWRRYYAGDPESAREAAEVALGLEPRNAHALHELIVTVHVEAGRREAAQASYDELERLHRQQPEHRWIAKTLMTSAWLVGDRERTEELIAYCERTFPDLRATYVQAITLCAIDGDGEAAEVALAKFRARDDGRDTVGARRQRAHVYYTMARAWGRGQHKRFKVVQYVVRALAAGGGENEARRKVRALAGGYPVEKLRATIERWVDDPAERGRIEGVIAPELDVRPEACVPVLEAHLTEIVRRVRAAGAEPVLLTYPREVPHVNDVQRRVAAAEGVRLADCAKKFTAMQGDTPRGEFLAKWFVPDRHCNDAGYAVMGEVVAEVVAEVLEAR